MHLVESSEGFRRWLGAHRPGVVTFDLEAFGHRVYDRKHGMAIKMYQQDEDPAYVLDEAFDPDSVLSFGSWLRFCTYVNQNTQWDLSMLMHQHDCIPEHLSVRDPMIAARLWKRSVGNTDPSDLDSLVKQAGHEETKDQRIKEWLKANGFQPWQMAWAPVGMCAEYACQDLRLVELATPYWEAKVSEKMRSCYEFECAIVPMFAAIEARGSRLDMEFVRQSYELMLYENTEALGRLKDYADINWSVNSKQVPEFLATLGIELIGTPSYDGRAGRWIQKPALHKGARKIYAEQYPEYMDLFDALNAYGRTGNAVRNYLRKYLYDSHEGRMYPRLNPTGTVTGRCSSSGPNFQNILRPEENEPLHYHIKRCIIADEGYTFFIADYSQAEFRVLLHYARESTTAIQPFIDEVEAGADIHNLCANRMFQIVMEEITKDERQTAKHFNFGLVYRGTFGNTHINDPVRKRLAERGQTGTVGHGRGQDDNPFVSGHKFDESLSERRSETAVHTFREANCFAIDSERLSAVKSTGVLNSGHEAAALFRIYMQYNRPVDVFQRGQYLYHVGDVMAVYWTVKRDTQLLKFLAAEQGCLDTTLNAIDSVMNGIAKIRQVSHQKFRATLQVFIRTRHPHTGQILGEGALCFVDGH